MYDADGIFDAFIDRLGKCMPKWGEES